MIVIMCMISDDKQLKEQIDISLEFFKNEDLLNKINFELQNNNVLGSAEKNFLRECGVFYSSCNSLLNTGKEDEKFFTTLEGKSMSYPIVRRLLEVYFNQIYIFDNKAEIKDRYTEYVNEINIKYCKMYNDLEKFNPSCINCIPKLNRVDSHYGDLYSNLQKLKNDNSDNLTFLYLNYRILCFYAHGNINDFLIKDLFGNNINNFPCIKVTNILGLIANGYLNILKENFSNII